MLERCIYTPNTLSLINRIEAQSAQQRACGTNNLLLIIEIVWLAVTTAVEQAGQISNSGGCDNNRSVRDLFVVPKTSLLTTTSCQLSLLSSNW